MTITIQRGETYSAVLRPAVKPYIYKVITAITKSAPVSITAPGHGLVSGQYVAVVSVKGMTQINADVDSNNEPRDKEYRKVTVVDANTITINDINSLGFSTYISGGALQYYTPIDFAGCTARRSFKDKVADTTADLWTASHAYLADDYVVLANDSVLQCTTAGTSGLTEPTVAGTDGTVVWAAVAAFTGSRELLRLTTENGGIVLDNTNHTITETISAAVTTALAWKKAYSDLDYEVTATGYVLKIGEVNEPVVVTRESTTWP